jgi:hypothetical protein
VMVAESSAAPLALGTAGDDRQRTDTARIGAS